MTLAFLNGKKKPRRDGFTRFRTALDAIPSGGEGHVWVRVPIQLGDTVMTLPSLFTVKKAWDELAAQRGVRLRFTIMGKQSVNLFREAVPKVFAACHMDGEFAFADSPFRLLKYWQDNKPLAVINYSKSDRIKLAAWLGRVPVRTGVADGSNNWCYQHSQPFLDFADYGHRVFRYLPMTRWLAGPGAEHHMTPLGPDTFGGASVMAVLRDQGWQGGPYVVFAARPLISFPERRWYPLDEPWCRLADLAREAGVTPVLAGGPEHRETLERLALASGSLCMGGRTSLPQLAALLANAMGTIAVDTGIAHLAAATGKPTVVVFSTGFESLDLPCGPRVVSLRGNPAGEAAYPLTPEAMAQASSPWAASTSTIPAERAWGILNLLAAEGTGEARSFVPDAWQLTSTS